MDISGEEVDGLTLDILEDFLLGEASGVDSQQDVASISRLIIAGDSLQKLPQAKDENRIKKAKKYGYDASAYNSAPITRLDSFLSSLLASIPVTLLPGESDPASVAIPQQPLHTAMFVQSRAFASHPQSTEAGWFDTTTNHWEGTIDGWRFLGNSGQPISDIFKYVENDDRVLMMEQILRWRIQAPTAPDTLCMLLHCLTKRVGAS